MNASQAVSYLLEAIPMQSPGIQSGCIALATFISEDAATFAAAALASTRVLEYLPAFLGAFGGIWLGDLGLYSLARWGRGKLASSQRWGRWLTAARQEEARLKFERFGTFALLLCRFVPGTRLPTYLAAGFAGMASLPFLLITGVAALIWTVVIFALVARAGEAVRPWIGAWGPSAWIVPVFLFAVWLLISRYAATRIRNARSSAHGRSLVSAIRRWEFWPAWIFYAPVAAWYVRLAVRYRSFTLPTVANPGIENGGLVGESKVAIQSILHGASPDVTAPAWSLPPGNPDERLSRFESVLREFGASYPVVLKPDVGQRGAAIRIVRDRAQALHCVSEIPVALVIQPYVEGPYEIGVFYARHPGQQRGRIVAVTEKIFPFVVGDGVRTLAELIRNDGRAGLIPDRYLQRLRHRASEVIPSGERVRLVEAGNHAQGCIFKDGRSRITPALEEKIDAVSQAFPGFFIGRYDIRFSKPEELALGGGFKIIELNGAGAEATHIYDDRYSVWDAYRSLFRQWSLVFEIGAANRQLGTKPCAPVTLWRSWRNATRLMADLPLSD